MKSLKKILVKYVEYNMLFIIEVIKMVPHNRIRSVTIPRQETELSELASPNLISMRMHLLSTSWLAFQPPFVWKGSLVIALIVLLVLSQICFPGVYGVSSNFNYQSEGSQIFGYTSTSNADSYVQEMIQANSRIVNLVASGYGDLSFSKFVSNSEGDYVLTTAYIKGESAIWSHHYYPYVYPNYVMASEDLTAYSAKSIFVSTNSWNSEGDSAYVSTYIADNAGYESAYLQDYWGVGVANANAAFAAQGFGQSQGDYIDALSLGLTDSLRAETEMGAGDIAKAYGANGPIVGGYASFGLAANNEAAVSLLTQGWFAGPGKDTTGTVGSQGFVTSLGQNDYGTSFVEATIPDLGTLAATPNPSIWPTMGFAGKDFTLSMLETKASGTQSTIQASADPAKDNQVASSGSFDYAGVAFTGKTASSNVAVTGKTPI
jgi:hypothetical protein